MKIAIFHELPEGGAKYATNKIGSLLKSFGHTVDLYYVADKEDDSGSLDFNSVYFYCFKPKIWKGSNSRTRIYKDTLELYKIYKLDRVIARDLDSKHYDFVLVNASQFIESPFILRFLKTRKFFYAHDPNYRIIYEKILDIPKSLNIIKFHYEKLNRLLRKKLDRDNLSKADLILTNSKFAKDVINRTYHLKSEVAYLGVNTNLFVPGEINKELDILFVGTFEPVDGYGILSKAIELIQNKPRVFAVPGKDDKTYDIEEMIDLYQKSRMVVCLAVNEPFGLVPLEAMACGIPVIAVNEGGYKETVVDGKTGFLIKRDASSLAEKIQKLLSDTKLSEQMGKAGREEVLKKWTWEKRGRELEKILLSHL